MSQPTHKDRARDAALLCFDAARFALRSAAVALSGMQDSGLVQVKSLDPNAPKQVTNEQYLFIHAQRFHDALGRMLMEGGFLNVPKPPQQKPADAAEPEPEGEDKPPIKLVGLPEKEESESD